MAHEKTRTLKATEVCSIIQACKDAGVYELKFGDLQVTFSPPTEYVLATEPHIPAEKALSEQKSQQIEKEAVEAEELRLRQEQIDMALIEDPLAWEQMKLEGELDAEAGHSGTE